MSSALAPGTSRLDSWKAIAAYLARDVRTVIRWEKERALPVHRVPGGRRNAVFALSNELDLWRAEQQSHQNTEPEVPVAEVSIPDRLALAAESRAPHRRAQLGPQLLVLALAIVLIAVAVLGLFRLWRAHRNSASNIAFITSPAGRQIRFAVSRIELPSIYSVSAADLNGDGILDLVAGSYSGSSVAVLIGKGDGTFGNAVLFGACRGTQHPAIADLDGDKIPDIAIGCQIDSTVSLLRGVGDGSFRPWQTLSFPCRPFGIQPVDFDRDGALDLAVLCQEGDVFVFRNQHGRFIQVFSFHTDHDLRFAAIADYDGDGFPDLALPIGRQVDKRIIQILFGSRDMKFRESMTLEAKLSSLGMAAGFMTTADFNGDGKPDICVANANGTFFAFLNRGGRSFSPPVVSNTGLSFTNTTFVDLDSDGKLDMVVTGAFENTVSVAFGRGDGSFSNPQILTKANYALLSLVADFNRDGHPDIAFTSPPTNTLIVLNSSPR